MAKDKQEEYRRLINDLASEDVVSDEPTGPRKRKFQPSYCTLVVVVSIQTLMLLSIAPFAFIGNRCPAPMALKTLYSPALNAIEHEIQVYHVGFPWDLSPYQIPSSPALDKAWEDLYRFGISKLSKSEAAMLPNKSHPIPGDETHYMAQLDVFHNLHCLNMIRKSLDPVYYPDWNTATDKNASDHINHCIDWIRQSIQCNADTSVIVWQWSDWANKTIIKGDVAHTCRNFEKIQDWAKQHVMDEAFDETVHIVDDIVVPVFHRKDL